jgi:hypothetical protein
MKQGPVYPVWGFSRSLSPVVPTLEHRTAVKRFMSLQCLNPKTVGRSPWTGISSSRGRYLHSTTQTQNKRIQTPMPRVGFEPTIPVFERAKTVHVLDRAVTVICNMGITLIFCVEIFPLGNSLKRNYFRERCDQGCGSGRCGEGNSLLSLLGNGTPLPVPSNP